MTGIQVVVGRAVVWTAMVWAALAGMGVAGARAQDGSGSGVTKLSVMAKDADPGWEVATVKPSDPEEKDQAFRVRGRHVMIQRQTVETMLRVGYSLQKNQIVDAPEWVRTENFDVDGVPDLDGEPSVPQFQSMVRKLLAERFGLKLHQDQREMGVFALKVGKDGPKLRASTRDPNTLPSQQVRGGEGYRTLEFTNVSIHDVLVMMLDYVDRPLVDQTGLTGRYDFDLKYTYDDARAPTDGTAPPGLFTAVQEQLGLKLEPVKAPADVLVIDAVQKPSAN